MRKKGIMDCVREGGGREIEKERVPCLEILPYRGRIGVSERLMHVVHQHKGRDILS